MYRGGDHLCRTDLKSQRGNEETATITASFHTKVVVRTKDRSGDEKVSNYWEGSDRELDRTEILWQKVSLVHATCRQLLSVSTHLEGTVCLWRTKPTSPPRKSTCKHACATNQHLSGDSSRVQTYHVVISRATMINSFKTRAVKEMDTMLRNSFSKLSMASARQA